ncbi:MAG: hypothetical protein ACTSQY_09470 [Candidatus Odinarchaeia archaeon]
MYIAIHTGCDTQTLNRVSKEKLNREVWLIQNGVPVSDFEEVCRKIGSRLKLFGISWLGEPVPENKLIYRDAFGKLKVTSI